MRHYRQLKSQVESRYREPIINSDGSFFCCACLEDKPKDDQSQDPRYCLNCFDILTFEASELERIREKHFWVPLVLPPNLIQKPSNQNLGEKILVTHPSKVHNSETVEQLDLFATTNYPPLPAPTIDNGSKPLSVERAILANSSVKTLKTREKARI